MNEYTAPQFDPAGLPMPRLTIELPGHRDFTTRVTVAIGDINYGGHLGNDAVLRLAQEARDLVFGPIVFTDTHRIRYSPAWPSIATTGASGPSMRSNPDMPVSRSRSNSTRPPSACAGAIRRTTGIFCSIADTRR